METFNLIKSKLMQKESLIKKNYANNLSKKDFILYSEAVLGILTYTVQKIPCHSSNF